MVVWDAGVNRSPPGFWQVCKLPPTIPFYLVPSGPSSYNATVPFDDSTFSFLTHACKILNVFFSAYFSFYVSLDVPSISMAGKSCSFKELVMAPLSSNTPKRITTSTRNKMQHHFQNRQNIIHTIIETDSPNFFPVEYSSYKCDELSLWTMCVCHTQNGVYLQQPLPSYPTIWSYPLHHHHILSITIISFPLSLLSFPLHHPYLVNGFNNGLRERSTVPDTGHAAVPNVAEPGEHRERNLTSDRKEQTGNVLPGLQVASSWKMMNYQPQLLDITVLHFTTFCHVTKHAFTWPTILHHVTKHINTLLTTCTLTDPHVKIYIHMTNYAESHD